MPLLTYSPLAEVGKLYLVLKRGLDLFFSTLLMGLLSPVFVAVMLLVMFFDGRPVFFSQIRPGRHGRPFVLYKFRTMEPPPSAVAGDESSRVTKLGAILRKSSIDELPSLWNLIRGDMSFVGPRPLLVDYLDIYSARHSRRHAVRPGLTGLAQVSGRNLVSWVDRLELDIAYIELQSFWLDLEILIRTLPLVIRAEGVTPFDQKIMPPLAKDYDSDE